MRRLLALLTSFAMLHLAIAGGELACGSHGGDAERGSGATSMHASAAMHMSPAQHDADSHGQDASQAPRRCCDAMSGCTTTMTVVVAERVDGAAIPSGIAHGVALTLPMSGRAAPEPPPPKA